MMTDLNAKQKDLAILLGLFQSAEAIASTQ